MAALAPGERPLLLDVEGVDVGVLVALGNILDSRLDAVSEAEAGVFIVVDPRRARMSRSVLCHRIGIPSQTALVWEVIFQLV